MKIARLFFIIFLFSLCNGENGAINSLCAVRFQYLGALVECTAGCFDIIDEQNRFAVNIETVNQIKCTEKIDASFLCRRAALCFGFADFIERFKARDTETVGDFLSQKFRLIIPSFSVSSFAERNKCDKIKTYVTKTLIYFIRHFARHIIGKLCIAVKLETMNCP